MAGGSAMSALQELKSAVPGLDDDAQSFECRECGTTFESDSAPERATCVNCLSDDVDPA
jgi:protein-arginine kinase activator protein McsA